MGQSDRDQLASMLQHYVQFHGGIVSHEVLFNVACRTDDFKKIVAVCGGLKQFVALYPACLKWGKGGYVTLSALAESGASVSPAQAQGKRRAPSVMPAVGLNSTSLQVLLQVRPSEVNFSHDSISSRFTCGRYVEQTYQDLRSGVINVEVLPLLTVANVGGKLYAYTGNRRLHVFRQLEATGRISKAE